jgi:hypothetical protein
MLEMSRPNPDEHILVDVRYHSPYFHGLVPLFYFVVVYLVCLFAFPGRKHSPVLAAAELLYALYHGCRLILSAIACFFPHEGGN